MNETKEVRMALSGLKTLLEEARRQGRAVGAFNVASVEMILGCLDTAGDHLYGCDVESADSAAFAPGFLKKRFQP